MACALSRGALGSDTGLFVNVLANDAERIFNFLQHAPFGVASFLGLAGIGESAAASARDNLTLLFPKVREWRLTRLV